VAVIEFKLPDVGEGIHEAEVLAWLVEPGQTVARDQPIVDIQTDKAVVQSRGAQLCAPTPPAAGRIAAISVPAGTVVRVGTVLVAIEPAEVVSRQSSVVGPAARRGARLCAPTQRSAVRRSPTRSTAPGRLPTTDYRLPTTDYRLPTTDYRLPTDDHEPAEPDAA